MSAAAGMRCQLVALTPGKRLAAAGDASKRYLECRTCSAIVPVADCARLEPSRCPGREAPTRPR